MVTYSHLFWFRDQRCDSVEAIFSLKLWLAALEPQKANIHSCCSWQEHLRIWIQISSKGRPIFPHLLRQMCHNLGMIRPVQNVSDKHSLPLLRFADTSSHQSISTSHKTGSNRCKVWIMEAVNKLHWSGLLKQFKLTASLDRLWHRHRCGGDRFPIMYPWRTPRCTQWSLVTWSYHFVGSLRTRWWILSLWMCVLPPTLLFGWCVCDRV